MSDASPDPHPHQAFGRTYWMLNSIEMFERLAYFGIRYVVPIYIMQASEPGGLHMTAMHKGWVYMWWAILQSWLPMVTGGIADRYGYKRVLAFAISLNVVGYLMMAYMPSYYGFFAGILVLATGTAFFKPALQGSIAQNLTKENSSMGWGVFYWVVNIGAVLAPLIATLILGTPHSAEGWRNLFIASAAYTAMNLLLLLTFRDVPSGADKSKRMMLVLAETIENIWPFWLRGGIFHPLRGTAGMAVAAVGLGILIGWSGQWIIGVCLFLGGGCLATWLRGGQFTWQLRLPAFLLIMSCFWMMMYQVWDLHPNFIEDWVDSAAIADRVPFDSWREYGDRGLIRVPQQVLITLNAFLIVCFVVPISYLVRKMRTLAAMLIGMSVAIGGTLVAGLTGNGWILLLGIAFFSLGEMLTGPKKNQYLGLIAPPGKKGLYLGYVNIPIGVGVGIGSMLAGYVYDNYGEKATLALKELASNPALVARAAQSADWSDALDKLPPLLGIDRDEALATAAKEMGLREDQAAATLRRQFKYDRGQIENLALLFLAVQTEYPTPDDEDYRAKTVDYLLKHHQSLGQDVDSIPKRGMARFTHLMPDALGQKRTAILPFISARVINRDATVETRKQEAEIVDLLWNRYGHDQQVLNNLALEYLAQATGAIGRATEMEFMHPGDEIRTRIDRLDEVLGLGRTKSFAALSAAKGADAATVEAALAEMDIAADSDPDDRVFTYLMGLPHRRFIAVARKDWNDDRALLRELIRTDEKALSIVLTHIDESDLTESIGSAFKRLFGSSGDEGEVTAEGVNYHHLARKQDLILKALDEKDWTAAPDQAAKVLGLNPFEARALVAAELIKSPQQVTRQLWEKYTPQYHVWIPFAAIGVLAAIALGIFGHMAKKWADMNA
jgi:MFS family permease